MDAPVRSLVLGALDFFVTEATASRYQEASDLRTFLGRSLLLLIVVVAAILISVIIQRGLAHQVAVIEAQNANIRLIYDASMLPVVVADSNGEIKLFNSAAEQTFGYTEADALGRNIADVMIPPHRLAQHYQGMERYRATGQGAFVNKGTKRTTSLRHDRTEFPVELSIRSETDAQGDTMLIAFIRDISEQSAFEQKLQEARDEARHHAATKTMFLATMSHEMRTPLHGLMASLELIDTDSVDRQTQDLIKTARSCGLQTLHQMDDVLELTRVGEVQERLAPFAPHRMVSKIIEELRPLAKERFNQLSLNVTGLSDDTKWLGHPQMFMRAMYNLIGNAIKFTQDGLVTINVNFDWQVAAKPRLCVSVVDNGRGISAEDQAHLFDLFFSSDAGQIGSQLNSSGLGLPIAQTAVQKMGGTITVESQLGVGSKFSFEIPLEALEDSQTPLIQNDVTVPRLSAGVRCLIVDDNHVNLDVAAQMLRRLGCDAVVCDNGEAAAESMVQQNFDVVFMDLNMPGGISGVEAAQLIRRHETSRPETKPAVVLALTADTTVTAAVMPEGLFDGIMHKPVLMHELRETLSRFLPCETADTRPDDALFDTTPEAFPDAFSDLFDLIGLEHGVRLLGGVLRDIDTALDAIRLQRTDAGDCLHRAIGSTASVGLLELSQQLRHAEDLEKVNAEKALSTLLTSLEFNSHRARECILRAQLDIRSTIP
nr:ATP-binding protein [Gymnodinialimonas phycosphaerae]